MSEHEVIYLKDRQSSSAATRSAFADVDSALAEANHRISNNLALLASSVGLRASDIARQDRAMESGVVAAILREIGARITTVGQLHRLLSTRPGTDRVDINDFLHELCETLVSALAEPGRVELLDTGSGGCVVMAYHVLPLSLIVTEAVTNSLKYAHPTGVAGKLMVGCRREDDGSLLVEVADDGVGLPEGFEFAASAGLGSRTIRALARQLGAAVCYESRAIGASLTLRLPAEGV